MELETSLTFAENQQVHLSLIDNDDLLNSLSKIPKYLNKLQNKSLRLPYPIELSTIHLYERLINIKAYQIKNSFTFIYEIPLVQKSTEYQLINLIPIPAHYKNQFYHMIIPTFNMILFSKEHSIPINSQHCSALLNNQYFCQKENHFSIPNNKLCETQLLSFDPNPTCTPISFPLSHMKIIKLTKNSWIVTSPQKIACEIQCPNNKYHKLLINTQLIQLTSDCSATINNEDTLFTFETSSKTTIDMPIATIGELKLKTINITKINVSLDLSHVDTNLLKQEQIKLNRHSQQLQKIDSPMLTHGLSISSIIITTIIILIITCIIAYLYFNHKTLLPKLYTKLQILNTPIASNKIPPELIQCKV